MGNRLSREVHPQVRRNAQQHAQQAAGVGHIAILIILAASQQGVKSIGQKGFAALRKGPDEIHLGAGTTTGFRRNICTDEFGSAPDASGIPLLAKTSPPRH